VTDDDAVRKLLEEARILAAAQGTADLRLYLRERGERVAFPDNADTAYQWGFFHASRVIGQLADLVEQAYGPPA
jgi:hypothetical protein